jgi:2',3'-cyclic-nucleotide 2'-phosphodiesterase (5'-nucleotidase family)
MNKSFLSLIILVLFGSCTFNQVPTKVLSLPDYKTEEMNDEVVKVVIASTQNFKGQLESQKIDLPETKLPQLELGGINLLSSYIKILRKVHGNSLILLDAGDLFNETSPENIPRTIRAYKELGYDGINLTDRELKVLEDMKYSVEDLPFLTSNILDLKTLKPTSLHGSLPYKIIEISNIKIGIISVTPFKAIKDKKDDFKTGLYFEDPVLSFLKIRKVMKRKGINLTVLMISEKNIDNVHRFVKRLPPNSVDVIVSGNTKSNATLIEGIPILQNHGEGKFISSIELYYDRQDRVIIVDKTKNHGMIKTCSRFFQSTMDCHLDKEGKWFEKRMEMIKDSKFQTVPAKFLGHEIKAPSTSARL